MSWTGEKGKQGTSFNCLGYGKQYNKFSWCSECPLATYCEESTKLEKVHVDYTTREPKYNISEEAKASNVSGELIAQLLELTNFNAIALFIVICRLGNLTYKQIAQFFDVSDVCIFKYCKYHMPKVLKQYLDKKAVTFIEVEEALKRFKNKEDTETYFDKTFKKLVQLELKFDEFKEFDSAKDNTPVTNED